MENVKITFELPDAEAWALAQFVKRVTFDDVRRRAIDEAETYQILTGVDALRAALSEAGYRPR